VQRFFRAELRGDFQNRVFPRRKEDRIISKAMITNKAHCLTRDNEKPENPKKLDKTKQS